MAGVGEKLGEKLRQAGERIGATTGSAAQEQGVRPGDLEGPYYQPPGNQPAAGGYSTEWGFAQAGKAGAEQVCEREYFTKTTDVPVIVERTEYVKQHHPVEKQFVVETRATGVEHELRDKVTEEVLAVEEHVVKEAPRPGPCD